jgi:hypothetical protein
VVSPTTTTVEFADGVKYTFPTNNVPDPDGLPQPGAASTGCATNPT